PHVREMYEGYISEPSQSENRDGWRSTYAAIAYLAGHYDVSRTQMEAVNWSPARRSLSGWGKDLSLLALEVAARTSAHSNRIAQAEKSYHRGDLPQAISIYDELLASDAPDSRTGDYCRCRLATLRREEQLAKGEWIDLLPVSAKDPDWAIGDERLLRRLEDGALEVKVEGEGHGRYSLTRFGPDCEVDGEARMTGARPVGLKSGIDTGLAYERR